MHIPDDLYPFILRSKSDTNVYKIIEGHPSLTPGIHNELAVYNMIQTHLVRQSEQRTQKAAAWRRSTNDRRAQSAAERKASRAAFRANVNALIQSLWPLLELMDGDTATVRLGDIELVLKRQGAQLIKA